MLRSEVARLEPGLVAAHSPQQTHRSSAGHKRIGIVGGRRRLDLIAAAIANAETTRTGKGGPYRRKMPVLFALPEDLRLQSVQWLLKAGEPAPETLQAVGKALAEKAASLGQGGGEEKTENGEGIAVLIDILNHAEVTAGKEVLDSLTAQDAELG